MYILYILTRKYIYTYTCLNIYRYISTCIHIFLNIYVQYMYHVVIYMYIYKHKYIYMLKYRHISTYKHIFLNILIYICFYTYAYITTYTALSPSQPVIIPSLLLHVFRCILAVEESIALLPPSPSPHLVILHSCCRVLVSAPSSRHSYWWHGKMTQTYISNIRFNKWQHGKVQLTTRNDDLGNEKGTPNFSEIKFFFFWL